MTVEDWLRAALADAERRELPALKPILEGLARSTEALREAEGTIALANHHRDEPDADR
jgi:hypothetical protein